jgi:hypothetical protein
MLWLGHPPRKVCTSAEHVDCAVPLSLLQGLARLARSADVSIRPFTSQVLLTLAFRLRTLDASTEVYGGLCVFPRSLDTIAFAISCQAVVVPDLRALSDSPIERCPPQGRSASGRSPGNAHFGGALYGDRQGAHRRRLVLICWPVFRDSHLRPGNTTAGARCSSSCHLNPGSIST